MKKINRLVMLAVIGASLGTTAWAQLGGREPGFGPPGEPCTNRPPAITGALLATNYAALAVYDTSRDGKLDATEQAAVAQALVEGKLQPPGPPHGPNGATPPAPTADMAQRMAAQMAAMYAAHSPYDANADGQLDDTEQAAVTAALADGSLKLPMHRGPGGRPGGGRGGRGGPGGPGGFSQ